MKKLKRHFRHIASPTNIIEVMWISDKYVNFIKDKIYMAEGLSVHVSTKQYINFCITDEDGDSYTLNLNDMGKKYIILAPHIW